MSKKAKPVLAWHFCADDKKLGYGDGRVVRAGRKYSVPNKGCALRLCTYGMHGSERILDALKYAPGAVICRVELSGEIIHGDDKLCATTRKVLAMADATRTLHEFAVWCARRALLAERKAGREPHKDSWRVLKVKLQWLNGKATDDELSAAWSAARSAAESAARSAAESAAWSAAWSAARSAAESAAWSAAESAARSAAESAVRSAARSAAESAARSAAWSAVQSAAESAARSAAWSAAESAARSAAESAVRSAARSAAESAVRSAARSAAESAARSAAWSAAERGRERGREQNERQTRSHDYKAAGGTAMSRTLDLRTYYLTVKGLSCIHCGHTHQGSGVNEYYAAADAERLIWECGKQNGTKQ
jgi:hypothetical protein